jgi:hypothetical protein
MSALLIGYARVSTLEQDLTAQRDALERLGVSAERIYVDHGLTGTNRERPGLREALAACRDGDTLVVTKLDRLARSLPDAREILGDLTRREVKLSIGGSVHDPDGPSRAAAVQRAGDGRRVRVRPDPAAHPGGHAHRQGQRTAARSKAEATSPPGSTPRRAAPRRGPQHPRARRAVRSGAPRCTGRSSATPYAKSRRRSWPRASACSASPAPFETRQGDLEREADATPGRTHAGRVTGARNPATYRPLRHGRARRLRPARSGPRRARCRPCDRRRERRAAGPRAGRRC